MNNNTPQYIYWLIFFAVIAIFTYFLGAVGSKVSIGFVFIFFFPAYLWLGLTNLEESERIIFALFLGIGIFSSIVYYLGLLIGSVRTATVTLFIASIILFFFVKKITKKDEP